MPSGAKPKVYPEKTVIAVRRLYENGATQHEIGAKLGLSQKVVFNVMRRHGIQARVAAKRDQWGKNNHAWKGDDASKQALHRRLYSRHGKPSKCSECGTEDASHYDYANITGHYEDMDDYAPMCRSCHWKFDDKINNIRAKGGMSNAEA
jgi:predicted Zn-ribbon and HTH transcriptional regulator